MNPVLIIGISVVVSVVVSVVAVFAILEYNSFIQQQELDRLLREYETALQLEQDYQKSVQDCKRLTPTQLSLFEGLFEWCLVNGHLP